MKLAKKIYNSIRIRYNWVLILIGIIAISLIILLQHSAPSTENTLENDRYLLSAISQGLAALFALIFTISLIVLQIAHKHKGLIEEFLLSKFNLFYPIMNAFGIVYPLCILKINFFPTHDGDQGFQ